MPDSIKTVWRSYPVGRMVIIIVIAGVLGLLRNMLFSDSISFRESTAITGINADSLSENITLEEARQLQQQGIRFLDARAPANYSDGHIPGALNIPASVPFQEKIQLVQNLDTDAPYVIYCNDPDCPLGDEIYEFLQVAGFTKLHIMAAGYDGWEKAGYAVAKGEATNAG